MSQMSASEPLKIDFQKRYLDNPPADYDQLLERLEECVLELEEKQLEYEQLETSAQEYESALEQDKASLEEQIAALQSTIHDLSLKFQKSETLKSSQKKEIRELETQVEKLTVQLEKASQSSVRIVHLELHNEELQNELRTLTFQHSDLELKFDSQIEELDLIQNELLDQKTHSEEQIERLKQQLVEIQADLEVKERELRNFKLKSLLIDAPPPGQQADLTDKLLNSGRSSRRNTTMRSQQNNNSVGGEQPFEIAKTSQAYQSGQLLLQSETHEQIKIQNSNRTSHIFSTAEVDQELNSLDINALIEGTIDTTDIENSLFFSNNIRMMKLLENSIAQIDLRLAKKRPIKNK